MKAELVAEREIVFGERRSLSLIQKKRVEGVECLIGVKEKLPFW
jgi:hypothetical protein